MVLKIFKMIDTSSFLTAL